MLPDRPFCSRRRSLRAATWDNKPVIPARVRADSNGMGSVARSANTASSRHTPLRVWKLIVGIAVCALGLWFVMLRPLDPVSTDAHVPWWALALSFAIVETFVINLHFRSESGSFSLLEVPMVVGLLFVAPSHLLIAVVAGAGVSLALVRRQPATKVIFNVSNLALHVAVAAVVFRAILGDSDPFAPWGWAAMVMTSLVSSGVEVLGINMVIGLAEGRFSFSKARNMMVFGALVAGANTVQALIAILIVLVEPLAVILLALSTGMLFIAYRAYVSEREHREQVEFLYQSTKSLRETEETDRAVAVLLEEACSMFRAGVANIMLFPPPDSDEEVKGYTCRDGTTRPKAMTEQDVEQLRPLVDLAVEPILFNATRPTNSEIRDQLSALGMADAMVGTLSSDHRIIGLLVVGERLGSVVSFTTEDLLLFANLTQQAAVALENDQLEQALSHLRSLERELSYQARYDVLTGLANRAMFTDRLDELIESEVNGPVTLLYVDLDDFKLVNDRLGHAGGDSLLVEVARRLESVVRQNDLVSRLGGDEFSVMLPANRDPEAIAQRIIGVLSAPFQLGEDEARIGASVGIAALTPDCAASELLHKADLAMYSAKRRGKGSVVWYTPDLRSEQAEQQALNTALRKSISERHFDVVYQPIVSVSDRSVAGAEALVRWRHGSGGLLTPDRFIAEAERSGLIIAIDRIVRDIVFAQLPVLTAASDRPFFVSVNISARNLHREGFPSEIADELLRSGIDPGSVVLEVTESAFAGDPSSISAVFEDLRATGARIALDDFGTGYSSLSYLRGLPIDLLKIAQPFISDLRGNGDSSFVDVIARLGSAMSLEIVAEGVEHEDQLEALRRTDCQFAQGFLFAVPMPFEELLELRSDGAPPTALAEDLAA